MKLTKFTQLTIVFIFIFFTIYSLFAIRYSLISAQTVSQQITLTFPIPQLDSCRDAKECYLYCEIPKNQSACQQFSSKISLPQVLGVSTSTFRQRVLQATSARGITFPIAQLDNCDSPEACREYCHEEENRNICREFSKRHNLRKRTSRNITFPVAELGNCDSRQTCKAYCQEEANKDVCHTFASTHNIRIRRKVHSFLQKAKQELGCETLEQCKSLCQNPDNNVSCRSFGLKHRQINDQRKIELQQNIPDNFRERRDNLRESREERRDLIRDRVQDRFEKQPNTPIEPGSIPTELVPTETSP